MAERVHFHKARNPDSQPYDSLRIPYRPLGEFSTFVITQLPSLLTQVRSGALSIDEVAEYVNRSAPSVESTHGLTGAGLKVARLDAQSAYNGLVHGARLLAKQDDTLLPFIPGPNISALANDLALRTGRPRILTYEDVVIDNPRQDMRTLTDGQVADSERGFFLAHAYIEDHLQVTIELMMDIIHGLEGGDSESEQQVNAALGMAKHWRLINDHTATLMKDMPREHFEVFREYLGSYIDPDTLDTQPAQLDGASGQGSSRMRETDFLLGGDTFINHEWFMADTTKLLPYYPVSGREQFNEVLAMAREGRTIHRLLNQVDPSSPLHRAMNNFAALKINWRQLHQRAVQTQMPDIATGTGGSMVDEYLERCIDATKNSYGRKTRSTTQNPYRDASIG